MTSTILLNALQYLGYILIFPGFLFCFLCGMLLVGIDRKLVARMQKRVGPPILQPFYDFFKHPRLQRLHRHGGHHRHPLPAADPGSGRDPRRCGLRLPLRGCRPEP